MTVRVVASYQVGSPFCIQKTEQSLQYNGGTAVTCVMSGQTMDMAAASCSIYETEGSVPLTRDLPQAAFVGINETGTNLAVVWNPDQALALIVFRGTDSNRGWIQVILFRVVQIVIMRSAC